MFYYEGQDMKYNYSPTALRVSRDFILWSI